MICMFRCLCVSERARFAAEHCGCHPYKSCYVMACIRTPISPICRVCPLHTAAMRQALSAVDTDFLARQLCAGLLRLTCSSASTVSGMMSGFFSSLSLPSSSRLAILLSLGPGEPSPVVVPWDSSLRLNRLRRRCRHGSRSTATMSSAATNSAADKPMMTGSVGVKDSGLRGRSVCETGVNGMRA